MSADDMKARAESVSVPSKVAGLDGAQCVWKVLADPMRTLPPGAGFLIVQFYAAAMAQQTPSIFEFQTINTERAKRWHGTLENWSGLEWAGAMCGEAGEAANVAKKLRRLELGLEGNQYSEHQLEERNALVAQLGVECADTLAYLALLCARYGVNLQKHAIAKFNKVSEQMGFPERL